MPTGSTSCSPARTWLPTGDVTLDTQWQGFTKGIFGSTLFMLKTAGRGDVFVDGWGGIRKVELGAGGAHDSGQLPTGGAGVYGRNTTSGSTGA